MRNREVHPFVDCSVENQSWQASVRRRNYVQVVSVLVTD